MKSVFRKPKVKDGPKQSLDVYCRLRPVSSPGPVCIKVTSPTTVHMIPASNSVQLRNGPPPKEMQYSFKKVFDENVSQKEVFETVAFPLVENLLIGNNGLLFTYGVTGSGKTFTMTGSKTDGGIMPRCIDTIFNSIGLSNAGKYIFKPDKLNGFEIQSEADALMERQQDLLLQLTPAKNKLPRLERMNTETEFLNRVPCDNKANIIEDNIYSVFVTFVEIYNNSVYDLLDEASSEGFRPTPMKGPPQVKIIREDSDHNMFVHGVNEVEVKNADEAFQVFGLGQKRRKVAHTALNAESSRAHTIFTIRVVQAPMDDFGQVVLDKKCISVGQLSLVDLAGSERTKRTENTGQRLREAGNINNSLMTLRSCLEILRENQKGANKMVPYRDSRLTHLFKSFFEGEGSVAMVVCANPRAEDYDENMHVLKFAEVSQEIQIFCPPTPKLHYASTPSRRRKLKLQRHQGLDKENKDSSPTFISVSTASEFFADIPAVGYLGLEDYDDSLKKSICYLESHLEQFESFGITLNQRGLTIRESFVNLDHEVQKMKALYDREKGKAADLESKVRNTDLQVSSYKRKIDEYDMNIKRLKRELSEKELLISKSKVDSSKVREQYNNKIAAAEEKLKDEMERRLRSQKSALEFELRSKERKLREAKRVLSDESLRTVPSTPEPERFRPPAPCTPLSMRPPSPNFRSTGRRIPATRRPRRSRSAESWLEHKPPAPTALPTVLQPVMTRRRSVSKLADAKDVLSSGADRYCLVTQGQDSDGDLEARIYKGDIVPTTSGGAQVTFSDVEILRQKSPTSPTRRMPSDPKANNEKQSTIPVKAPRFRH